MGPTAEMILDAAEHLGASHLVVGSHGHGGLHHLLVGSVAEEVVRHARSRSCWSAASGRADAPDQR